jgi:hypothetical protein
LTGGPGFDRAAGGHARGHERGFSTSGESEADAACVCSDALLSAQQYQAGDALMRSGSRWRANWRRRAAGSMAARETWCCGRAAAGVGLDVPQ